MEAIEAPKTFANDLAVVKEYIKKNLSTETNEYTDEQIEDARIDISLLLKKKRVTLKTIALIAGLDCDVYHRAIRSNNNNRNAVTKLNLYLVEEEKNSELWLLIENVHKWCKCVSIDDLKTKKILNSKIYLVSPLPKRRAPVPMINRRRRSRSVDSMSIVSSSFRKEIVDLKLELKNASSKVQELMKIDETRVSKHLALNNLIFYKIKSYLSGKRWKAEISDNRIQINFGPNIYLKKISIQESLRGLEDIVPMERYDVKQLIPVEFWAKYLY